MTHNVQDGQGITALDHEAILSWIRGDTIVTGCAPSAGSGSLEVDVASGTARVNGSNVSVSSGTATLDSGGSNPRKDVVYVDAAGAIQVAKGTAATAAPSGNTRFATYEPAPQDLSSTDAAVVAEVWVASGQSGVFASADIRDRRVLSALDLDSVTAASVTTDSLITFSAYNDVTGSRSLGTWETNDTGGDIYVSVTANVSSTDGSPARFVVDVDASQSVNIVNRVHDGNPNTDDIYNLAVIVPDGLLYRFRDASASGTSLSLNEWQEST